MPVEAFAMLAPHLRRVGLNRRTILQERNRRLEEVHFIEAGVASILAWTPQDGSVQVGLVGRFGLVGVSAILGVSRSPQRCLMQTDGEALRVPVDELSRIVDAFPNFRYQILNYVHSLLIQNSQLALTASSPLNGYVGDTRAESSQPTLSY
jgi:CRP-like cAMP-binding protein